MRNANSGLAALWLPIDLVYRALMGGDALVRGFDALQIGLGLVFVLSGVPKLLGTWRMRAMFDHLRVPQPLRFLAGAVEVTAGAGLLWGVVREPAFGVVSALMASPVMFGAMMTNLTRSRRRDAWMTTAILLFWCLLIAYVRRAQGV